METAVATPPRRRATRPGIVVALAAAVLLTLAAGWHLDALAAYDRTTSPEPLVVRLEYARYAARLEPWNPRFEWRAVTLEALALFERGDVDEAYRLLEPYSQVVKLEDPYFRSVYSDVVRVKTSLDSGKAHLAHGADPYLDFRTDPSGPASPTTPSANATGSVPATP
jgi:hypothetical protein